MSHAYPAARSIPLVALLAALFCGLAAAAEPTADEAFFERKIRPVLVEHCYGCHSQQALAEDKLKGNLRLDTRQAIRQGGDSGAAVVPGKPEQSVLLEALRYESFEMPPSGQLSEQVILDFEQWIRDGAVDPRDESQAGSARPPIDWQEARQHWSFQPPQRHPLPAASNPAWVQRPIDAFVLARLDRQGLQPNSPASRRTLIRRLAFDLVGLPPSPEEVDRFLADDSPAATAQLVERLLASPRYGEHWARMWLDVARYAEDQAHIVGDNRSLFYPNAYLYRDWVISALNNDMPYDRFVQLQLAADLLAADDPDQQPALGFIGLGPKYYRRGAPEVMADEWEDRVDLISRGLLGLTVACARCHDHKYDPIPTEDYYALAGVFASTEMFNRPLEESCEREKDGQAKQPEQSMHVIREAEPKNLKVHIRGDVTRQGQEVPRGFVQVISRSKRVEFHQGSGRAELAQAIIDRGNPLTARVIVNRVWARHFGNPLVGTPSNFGALGEAPSHPELLDDLAVRFMENGWSLKWLHREIVLSATWQQSSDSDPRAQQLDPANRWLSRMNRRRLDVEAWRDVVLWSAGRLEADRIGGESIDPQDPEQTRRTVYSQVSRLDLNPLLATFDFPDPNAHAERRAETTTPLQKLFLLNSPFIVEQAAALADRCLSREGDDIQRIEWAIQSLYGRDPYPQEVELALEFLVPTDELDRAARWRQYAQVLLCSNELMFVD